MRILPLLAAALIAVPASAQISNPVPVPTDVARTSQIQAVQDQVSTIVAAMPRPATTIPPTEAVGGSAGTPGIYRPADAVPPRITRATVVTADSSGNWSVTWSSGLMSVPVILPVPINTATQPIVCNVSARTMTTASGRCWLARTLPATLTLVTNLVQYDVFGAPAAGATVQVFALPPTQ